eukprot:TRINITY_DN59083_c0_g1_i1.p1 TRINITY_DN59083_c0_g1~~TRINITY_DN59083_c0_g1_i1.p1  ORF type:complete len:312 (-),score=17.04 TRINITY_DN59083_c0_g1_i1:57-992(-)
MADVSYRSTVAQMLAGAYNNHYVMIIVPFLNFVELTRLTALNKTIRRNPVLHERWRRLLLPCQIVPPSHCISPMIGTIWYSVLVVGSGTSTTAGCKTATFNHNGLTHGIALGQLKSQPNKYRCNLKSRGLPPITYRFPMMSDQQLYCVSNKCRAELFTISGLLPWIKPKPHIAQYGWGVFLDEHEMCRVLCRVGVRYSGPARKGEVLTGEEEEAAKVPSVADGKSMLSSTRTQMFDVELAEYWDFEMKGAADCHDFHQEPFEPPAPPVPSQSKVYLLDSQGAASFYHDINQDIEHKYWEAVPGTNVYIPVQ